MIKFPAIIISLAVAPGFVSAQVPCPAERICSTLGFSFEAPVEPAWRTEFGSSVIQFQRVLDPSRATMHAGAIEGRTASLYGTGEELVAKVRGLKSRWGSDGRYRNIRESFEVEAGLVTCVRYKMAAEDTQARSRGAQPFLPLLSVGRFCLHPQDRRNAVDLYYSIRSSPDYDITKLVAEGEALLSSLKFSSQ
ncbi:hypothetical protein [Ramlibacter sp.]|uniref:hypothetical protein n=1 Tax=Ramlibacter sp. TaxID=1917967 RepID=UPI002BAC4A01|nr:hypothetical protein [Ramlibacter sp.]HWI83653.1 hypothetical protein [Ramlibacter sp.]